MSAENLTRLELQTSEEQWQGDVINKTCMAKRHHNRQKDSMLHRQNKCGDSTGHRTGNELTQWLTTQTISTQDNYEYTRHLRSPDQAHALKHTESKQIVASRFIQQVKIKQCR